MFYNGQDEAVHQRQMLDAIEELRRQIEALTQHVVQNQVPSNDGVGSEEEGYHHEEEFVNRFHKNASR